MEFLRLEFWRFQKDKLLRPIVPSLSKLGMTANHFTWLTIAFGVLSAISIHFFPQWFILLILLSLTCDIFDGAIARYQRKTTQASAIFDYLADSIAVFSLMVSVAIYERITQDSDTISPVFIVPILFLIVNSLFIVKGMKDRFIYVRVIYYVLFIFTSPYLTSLVITGILCLNCILIYMPRQS